MHQYWAAPTSVTHLTPHTSRLDAKDNGTACGTKLDHGVLVVGLTADAYIVKVGACGSVSEGAASVKGVTVWVAQ